MSAEIMMATSEHTTNLPVDMLVESPCPSCDLSHMDKDECMKIKQEACPLYTPPEPIFCNNDSVNNGAEIPTEKICVVCGKVYRRDTHKGYAAWLAQRTCGNQICTNTIKRKAWAKKRGAQCGFPGCQEVATNKYCKRHVAVVGGRKRMGWDEKDLHNPLVPKNKGEKHEWS